MTKRRNPVETGRRAAVRDLLPRSVIFAMDRAERSPRKSTAPNRNKELFERTERAKVRAATSSDGSAPRSGR